MNVLRSAKGGFRPDYPFSSFFAPFFGVELYNSPSKSCMARIPSAVGFAKTSGEGDNLPDIYEPGGKQDH